jgi:predicted alpha/beta-fold hydrolase
MEIFLISMFCQNWITYHSSLRQLANCHELYSVGDDKDVISLLTRTHRVLEKHPYNPPLYCSFDIHGQLQTTIQFLIRNIGAQYLILSGKVVFERELLTLEDGGLVALDWITLSSAASASSSSSSASAASASAAAAAIPVPTSARTVSTSICTDSNPVDAENENENENESDVPTIIMHHGLCGDASSEHIVFMARKFLSSPVQKFRVVCVVMRGCGGLDLMTSHAMHGARTCDLKGAIEHIHRKLPRSRLFGIGFSLGAGVMLKYLGQEGGNTCLEGAYCVSPPWDGKNQSMFFPLWALFLAIPVKVYALRHRQCFKSAYHLLCILLAPTLGCVDELLTENHGYETLAEYYSACSPAGLSHNIQVPTLSVSARDDPVCYHASAPAPLSLSRPALPFTASFSLATPSLSLSPPTSASSSLTSSALPSSSSLSSTLHHHPLSTTLHYTSHNENFAHSGSSSDSSSDSDSGSNNGNGIDAECKDPEYGRKEEREYSGNKVYSAVSSKKQSSHGKKGEGEQREGQGQGQEMLLPPTASASSPPVCRLMILKTLLGGHIGFPCTTSSSSTLPPSLRFPLSSWCESWCDDVALDWVLGFFE